MNKIAIVTGGTRGIGLSITKGLIAEGYQVAALYHGNEDAAQKCATETGAKVFKTDVADFNACKEVIAKIEAEMGSVNVLVNNAGLALGLSPIHEGNTDDWDTMIDTNIKGLLYISKQVANLMVKNGLGHIIHIGSIAGRESYANGNVYCATKHAVDGLTKAMRIDLLPHNIKVTQIAPGAVETEFSEVRFKGDKQRAAGVYNGFKPLTGTDIADAVYYAASLPLHVNINDLLIMPMAQANATTIDRRN